MNRNIPDAELLLCEILRNFETLALSQYEAVVPALVNDDKYNLIERLQSLAPNNDLLDNSDVRVLVLSLKETIVSYDKRLVLLNQAFLLELVGAAIYRNVGSVGHISDSMRSLCALGLSAGEKVRQSVIPALKAEFLNGDEIFLSMIESWPKILTRVDTFVEGLDRNFGNSFGLSFGDLIGEFVSEVVDLAIELGIDRRKLMAFLTHAMMET